MANITDFIRQELYPALFPNIDRAFPSYHFTQATGGRRWYSPLHVDGSESKSRQRYSSYVDERKLNRLADRSRGESIDLISLYQRINGGGLFEAIEALCSYAGIEPPKRENSEEYEARRQRREKLEQLHSAMIKDLWNTTEGRAALSYLIGNRGYSEDFIKWAEFGYCSPATASSLREILDGERVFIPYSLGTAQILSIPYNTGGYLRGFIFRGTEQSLQEATAEAEKRGKKAPSKYTNVFFSATATKGYNLFGLTGLQLSGTDRDRDIIVVEGELDALRATFAGVRNVVAASGGNLSVEALRQAKSKGAKRVTLLFDTEATNEQQRSTYEKVEKAISTIHAEGLSAYVCFLPSEGGKMDIDEYLKAHAPEQLQAVIRENTYSGSYFLYERLHDRMYELNGGASSSVWDERVLDELKRQAIKLANSSFVDSITRGDIFQSLSETLGKRITKEDIQEEADREKALQDAKKQDSETRSLIAQAARLADEGKAGEALSLLAEKTAPLQRISMESEYRKHLLPRSKDSILTGFRTKPTGTPTLFEFGEGDKAERLLLPNGALTYICAPTSHGKSRMLENLALQVATNGEEGRVLYFTYEEDEDSVNLQLLNIFSNMHLSANNLRTLNSYYRTGEQGYFRRDVNVADFKEKEEAFFGLLTSGKLQVIDRDYDSSELIEAIRFMAKETKIKAVFVDYIQLLHKRGTRLQRKDELKEICKDLMTMAKETGLPVVLAAQLNREAFSPVEMACQNIAEASDIEHSANIVLLLWNSSVKPLPKSGGYFTDKKGTLSDEAQRLQSRGFNIGTIGTMYAILAKNRGGARNIDAVLKFNGNTGVVEPNCKPETKQPEPEPVPSSLFPQQEGEGFQSGLPF